jgi:forkhead box protein K
VLPPPPPPEDTPSPSSQSSTHRHRSPSVDITSISPPSSQPSHSPPPREVKLLPPSPPLQVLSKQKPKAALSFSHAHLPNSNSIGKSTKSNPKKRKKGDVEMPSIVERPKPERMPPKPPFTYAQLIYRAIKDIGGKATLQEICNWITSKHEYYQHADAAWMVSVISIHGSL